MKLNERIAALRKDNKMSQEAVAEALNVSRQAVSKWETGRSYPDTENLLKLAALYRVPVDSLLEQPGVRPDPGRKNGVRRIALACCAVLVIAAALIVLLNKDAAPSVGGASPPAGVAGPSASDAAAPPSSPEETGNATLDVYLAFQTLSKDDITAAEEYDSRLTVYSGLRALDWTLYSTYGEAGRDTDTRLALLNWLAEQTALSSEELDSLVSGMDNRGIDGAYCEPYAQALSGAFIAYPLEFVKSLASLGDAEYAEQVCGMTVYGAAYSRLGEAKSAADSALGSGALTDGEYVWAEYLRDRCDDPYGEGAPEDESAAPAPAPASDSEFVKVADYIPGIAVDLKYAAADNFTGKVIYDFTDAYLRYGTVKKLAEVQTELKTQGYGLLIWDAFRPVSAQFKLWEACPDAAFVADPNKGYSSHSRGNTVDITLTDAAGSALPMPSGFDNFTALADRDYGDASPEEAADAALLESVMTAHGFKGYSREWWHYADADAYPVEETFEPGA